MAQQHCPALVPQAQDIQKKFREVLGLFHSCHKLYDSSTLTDAEITELGRWHILKHTRGQNIIYLTKIADNNIRKFMAYYRQNFPNASVLPKMHFLEEHVVPWIKT